MVVSWSYCYANCNWNRMSPPPPQIWATIMVASHIWVPHHPLTQIWVPPPTNLGLHHGCLRHLGATETPIIIYTKMDAPPPPSSPSTNLGVPIIWQISPSPPSPTRGCPFRHMWVPLPTYVGALSHTCGCPFPHMWVPPPTHVGAPFDTCGCPFRHMWVPLPMSVGTPLQQICVPFWQIWMPLPQIWMSTINKYGASIGFLMVP